MRVAILTVLSILVATTDSPLRAANLVANQGFEVVESYVGPWPATFGFWKGDISQVVGAEQGIAPIGAGMLKFVNTRWNLSLPNGQTGDLVQLIDLKPHAGIIASGAARIRFSAKFNRVADDGLNMADTAFSIRLFANQGSEAAFTDNPGLSVAFGEMGLLSDNDPATWEAIEGRLTAPATTRYLAVMLRASENVANDVSNEFAGHYVDDVVVELVPESSGPCLFTLASVALCSGMRKSLRGGQLAPGQ